MDTLRTRIFIWLIFFLSFINNGNMTSSTFCRHNTPVLNICQKGSWNNTKVLYIDSTVVPIFQASNCSCKIQRVEIGNLDAMFTFSFLKYSEVSNLSFKFNNIELSKKNKNESTFVIGDTYLRFYNPDDNTKISKICLNITSDVSFNIECTPSRDNRQTSPSGHNPSVSVTHIHNVTDQTPQDAARIPEIALPIGAGVVALILIALVIFIVSVHIRRKHKRPRSKAITSEVGGGNGMYDEAYAMRQPVDNLEDDAINNDKVEYNYIDHISHQSNNDADSDVSRGRFSHKTDSLHLYDYTSCSEVSGAQVFTAVTNIQMTTTYDSVKGTRQNPDITDNEYSKFGEAIENNTYNSINTHSKFKNKKLFARTNEDYSALDVRKTKVKAKY